MKNQNHTGAGHKTIRPGFLLLLAAAVWLLVFIAFLRFSSGGLTLFYEIPPEATGHELVFKPEGIARVTDSAVSEDGEELTVRLSAVSRGTAEAELRWDGLGEDSLYEPVISSRLYALPFGILFDSVTWNFSGWEFFTGCISFFFLTAAFIFFAACRREKERVHFSYRATAYLGLAIFFLVVSFLRTDMLLSFLRGENGGTVWALLVGTIATAQSFMRWTAFVIAGFALATAVSNLVLIRHEGMRPSNMLGIAVAAMMVGGAALGIWMSESMLRFPMRNVLLNVYSGMFAYLECLLSATVIRTVEAGRHEPEYDRDAVLILGCKIRPDGTLYPLIRDRVDRAIAFSKAQLAATGKQPVLIPSGGRGPDEPMAEAEAMAAYLREKGIPEEMILPEDRSTTTKENLRFSKKLLEESGRFPKELKAAFSTSSYHVYRGGMLAAGEGWNIDGMGSRTRWYFWPNAFLREFIGLMAADLPRQVITALLICLLSAGLTALVM